MTRRKFSSKFKTKVVLEALKERMSMSELARKFELQPQQIVQWKKEFLNSAEEVFDKKSKDSRSESEKEKDRLLKTIGELKVEKIYLNPPKDGLDLYLLLAEYFGYYNNQRRHQSLNNEIPNQVYQKSVKLFLNLA